MTGRRWRVVGRVKETSTRREEIQEKKSPIGKDKAEEDSGRGRWRATRRQPEGMETGESVSGSNSCPRSSRLRLGFFSSLALALAVIVIVSGFYYKSVPISVEKETRLLAVDTLNFKRPRFNTGIIVPRRTDRGDNMASTDSRLNWSSLVGTNAEEAKNKIKEQHPHLHVVVVAKDAMMTMDYNVGRVRIFKDDNQNVAWIPKLG